MPGNESVTDNMKSFVGGVALKQAFYNIKTYNAQAISTAITNHNADAAHRHLPAVPTTSPPTGTFSYLTNSQTPAWSTLPTSDAVDSSSSSQLATSKAVSTLNTNLFTSGSGFYKINNQIYLEWVTASSTAYGATANNQTVYSTSTELHLAFTFPIAFSASPPIIWSEPVDCEPGNSKNMLQYEYGVQNHTRAGGFIYAKSVNTFNLGLTFRIFAIGLV